jgi:intraflagellar transport protein 80
MFAVSCMDGTFRFISRSGREEKKFTAHEGAVIVVKWSHDGTALFTAGEDGDLKVWSRSGNLRSTLLSTGQPIYSAAWGPDDDSVLIASGKTLTIKSIQIKKKNVQWNAHEGIILCTDWNVANNMIISGGEDCVYRVWDSFGRQLLTSRPMEHVVNSVAWSPNGEVFAVGSYNLLRLCDKTGWTHCRERLTAGSVMDIAWTSDGTQLAGACGSGSVLFAQVVDRKFEWKNVEATVVEARRMRVSDVAAESVEEIDFARDRIVEVGLGFDHLVVTTTNQCYVYNISNLNTPIIFDIRAPSHFIHLCKSHFLTLDLISGIQVINYDGRVISSPKFQGLRSEYLTKDMVAISPDTIAVVDNTDAKIIQLMDAMTGRNLNKLTHSVEVSSLVLNQHSLGPQDRMLAFADKNRDLFIYSMASAPGAQANNSAAQAMYKLHAHVESFTFNDETDVLVGLSDGKLNVWYSPAVALLDKDLIPITTSSMDASEYGRNAQIVAYTGNRISVRKVDGSFLYTATSVDIPLLYELVRGGKWEEAIRLCRHQKNSVLWGALASMAIAKKHLDAAETALCEVNEVAKVEYIQYIKSIPSEEGRTAEMSLFKRQPDEAERILLQASPPLIYRAIKMNINLYRWNRALEIALKFKSHVDTVLAYRQQYLQEFGKTENMSKFQQYASQVSCLSLAASTHS